MNREELQDAIENTKVQIYEIKQQIAQTADPREKRRLTRRKRELQYLQLWHLDQMKGMEP